MLLTVCKIFVFNRIGGSYKVFIHLYSGGNRPVHLLASGVIGPPVKRYSKWLKWLSLPFHALKLNQLEGYIHMVDCTWKCKSKKKKDTFSIFIDQRLKKSNMIHHFYPRLNKVEFNPTVNFFLLIYSFEKMLNESMDLNSINFKQ